MKPPRLNRKLTLESPQRLADGSGGYAVVWQNLGTIWADVISRSGRETRLVDQPVSETSFKIVVRAAPFGDPARPVPDQRFRDGPRIFLIRAIAETDVNGRFLTCYATQETAV
jgi:head-tail adaptor